MRDNLQLLEAFLRDHQDIQHVQINLNDYCNDTKSQSVPIRRAFQLAVSGGGYKTRGSNLLCRDRFGAAVPKSSGVNDDGTMVVDWTTLMVSAADPKVAYVLVKVHTPKLSNPFAFCPRSILQNLVKMAEMKYGIQIKMGWEIEFCLLESCERTAGVVSAAERHPSYQVVEDTVEHLEANDIVVWVHHVEANATTPGSFEISLEPASPLKAADNMLFGLYTMKDMAQMHGYTAMFHPVPFDNAPTSGQHINLSISKLDIADSFLAGMMARLKETTAFLLGGQARNSTKPWTCPLGAQDPRYTVQPPSSSGRTHHHWFEGVERGMKLGKAHTKAQIVNMTADERVQKNVAEIPRTQDAAMNALEIEKTWWAQQLGKECIEGYIANRKVEMEYAERMSLEEERRFEIFHRL